MSSLNKWREFSKKQLITVITDVLADRTQYANKLTQIALYLQKHGSMTMEQFQTILEAE